MRRLVVLEHITLDGVIQGPGGPEEDTIGGFSHGGWIRGFSDPILGGLLQRQMHQPFDLLLGRRTFEIWEPYWPRNGDHWPEVNLATKYVVSGTRRSSTWKPCEFLDGDIAGHVARIKGLDGPEVHVWGSGQLVRTLLEHDLVDAIWLMIYPITLGAGKRLFSESATPRSFTVTESDATTTGVLVVRYERPGPVATGG